jgi:hypothetical protein
VAAWLTRTAFAGCPRAPRRRVRAVPAGAGRGGRARRAPFRIARHRLPAGVLARRAGGHAGTLAVPAGQPGGAAALDLVRLPADRGDRSRPGVAAPRRARDRARRAAVDRRTGGLAVGAGRPGLALLRDRPRVAGRSRFRADRGALVPARARDRARLALPGERVDRAPHGRGGDRGQALPVAAAPLGGRGTGAALGDRHRCRSSRRGAGALGARVPRAPAVPAAALDPDRCRGKIRVRATRARPLARRGCACRRDGRARRRRRGARPGRASAAAARCRASCARADVARSAAPVADRLVALPRGAAAARRDREPAHGLGLACTTRALARRRRGRRAEHRSARPRARRHRGRDPAGPRAP